MPIPDFQTLMLPILQDLTNGERSSQQTHDSLAEHFALTPEELVVRIPSGRAKTFQNRIGWAKTHMKAAGLISSPRRGVYLLTSRGRDIVASNPPSVGLTTLTQYPEYVAFREGNGTATVVRGRAAAPAASADARTPDELIEEGHQQLRLSLVVELRERIAQMSPQGFEQLVIDVLTAMGYGGPQEDSGLVVGRSGDGGIDGVIKEDRLGLETIYVQAKRWENTVGRPDIQRFAGALQGQRARKGVFITASTFSAEAREYATSIQTTIVLVDGAQLAELMIDHDVGVTLSKRVDIKRIDSDYFADEG